MFFWFSICQSPATASLAYDNLFCSSRGSSPQRQVSSVQLTFQFPVVISYFWIIPFTD